MKFETEESSERRYMGTITGVSDINPTRWPGSKWRCLRVGWDEDTGNDRQERVSAWEIEPFVAPNISNHLPGSRMKRMRQVMPATLDLNTLATSREFSYPALCNVLQGDLELGVPYPPTHICRQLAHRVTQCNGQLSLITHLAGDSEMRLSTAQKPDKDRERTNQADQGCKLFGFSLREKPSPVNKSGIPSSGIGESEDRAVNGCERSRSSIKNLRYKIRADDKCTYPYTHEGTFAEQLEEQWI